MDNKIREYRILMGMSQAELADSCGVSRETICRIEKNNSNPSLALAMRIAAGLNASVEELFVSDFEAILQ